MLPDAESKNVNQSRNNKSPSASRAAVTSSQARPAGRRVDWAEELRKFYTAVKAPEKIEGIPTILNTWAGK
jgi:hypothetical protein